MTFLRRLQRDHRPLNGRGPYRAPLDTLRVLDRHPSPPQRPKSIPVALDGCSLIAQIWPRILETAYAVLHTLDTVAIPVGAETLSPPSLFSDDEPYPARVTIAAQLLTSPFLLRASGRLAGWKPTVPYRDRGGPRGSRSYPPEPGRVLLGSAGWRCYRSVAVPYRYVQPSCRARFCERDDASVASPRWNPTSRAAVAQPKRGAVPSAEQRPGVVDPCCTA
jgi:hypothetical protein